jgi:hypothetical protein
MKPAKSKLKKGLLISGIILILIPVIIIIFISPITKYLVEKYSVKYTGRQVRMKWAYVNPFTGYVYFKNIKINEYQSDSLFITANGLSGEFSLRKLFSNTCELTQITLDEPRGIFIESKEGINFRDLIERFKSKDSTKKSSFHLNILNMKVNDGILSYRQNSISANLSVIHLNIESPGLRWDMDTLAAKVSLASGNGGGNIDGNITINLKNLDYKLNAVISKLELKFLEQYFKQLSNYGSFRASLDADITASGNFRDAESINGKGLVTLNDFHFGESADKDFASFDKFTLKVNALNPKNKEYQIDSISLDHPYFKYEQYDYLNNLETMFEKQGEITANAKQGPERFNLIVAIGDYIKVLAQNFLRSDYKVNRAAIYRGDLRYKDYSLNEEFSIDMDPVTITADSINKNKSRVKLYFRSGIKPYGSAILNLSINPQDSSDFDLTYNLQKLPITLFNPYFIKYTSFPLDRGTLELHGIWNVRKGIIQSENHFLVIDPRITRRLKNKANSWVPMWLLMAFVRPQSDVIDYSIPITGDLKRPTFHLHDVAFGILSNIFVKPATTPYRMNVKKVERVIEKSLTLKWRMRQSLMLTRQEKLVEKMADFLAKTPNASIIISPQEYSSKEKEYILFFEAKKKYYLSCHPEIGLNISEGDSETIDKMSIKDSSFVHYLNKHLTRAHEFTIQDKCTSLLGTALINTRFNQLNNARKDIFLAYFKEKGVDNKVTFKPAKNTIPYDGLSFYTIEYKGEMPDFLLKAYAEMDELNSEEPREKYKNDRGKIKS